MLTGFKRKKNKHIQMYTLSGGSEKRNRKRKGVREKERKSEKRNTESDIICTRASEKRINANERIYDTLCVNNIPQKKIHI